MAATLAKEDVEFDIRLQLQTDPHLMPLENNGVLVAGETVAARLGGHAADSHGRNSISPRRLDFARSSPTIHGTAFRSIVRWEIRAAPGDACTRHFRSCGTG